jgi:hypothetical protein
VRRVGQRAADLVRGVVAPAVPFAVQLGDMNGRTRTEPACRAGGSLKFRGWYSTCSAAEVARPIRMVRVAEAGAKLQPLQARSAQILEGGR